MTTIRLPWPAAGLQPHAKGHWRPKAKATRASRAEAFWLAKEAKIAKDPTAILTFAFLPPDRRRRDLQNMPGMMKSAIDGIADAMNCDDHGFRCRWPDAFGEPVKGGAVLVTIGG